MLRGSLRVNTLASRSSALLVSVTRCDQRVGRRFAGRSADRFVERFPERRLAIGTSLLPADYIARYLGPLPPSRGVHRGPSTSVALQSTQLGGFTRSSLPARSYTPAGQTWV